MKRGLHERVIDLALARELRALRDRHEDESLDVGDSHAVLARHLTALIEASLRRQPATGRRDKQVALVNELVATLARHDHNVDPDAQLPTDLRRLLSVYRDVKPARPNTPASQTSLLTGTRVDPSLISQLKQELASANRVDFLCSFIKWSGIDLLRDALNEFCQRDGAQLRVITTSYMGASDLGAVKALADLPNTTVKVSYDTHRTRLHAKAYLFERDSEFSAAYIGSANVSRPALTEGLEWTLKVTQYADAPIWEKVRATFETYWADDEFELFDEDKLRAALATQSTANGGSPALPGFTLKPYQFQTEILETLAAERAIGAGPHRQLVVAATGTGKTMIAAFDYRRQVEAVGGQYPALLFIAHRREILEQGLGTFRAVLRDQNFGDLLDGRNEPMQTRHVFATIQTLDSRRWLTQPGAIEYEYVVVDEGHHAAANSYQGVLDAVTPNILLGLTATPERTDGEDIRRYFGYRIAAEIRLPDAISRRLIVPFHYFGVSDRVNYDHLSWQRGGYQTSELDRLVTGNDVRAGLVLDQCFRRLLAISQARALGFCVSVAHAEFMAQFFNAHGVAALALSGKTPAAARDTAHRRLRAREVNFIFAVDLYNEGVDIPELDTILFLRPTESLTVFLQQLGRGLRLADDKDYVTVLDFVGRMHRQFRFDRRLRALTADPSRSLVREIEQGFPHLPAGCSITLERQAEAHIMENIRASVLRGKRALARGIADFENETGQQPTLARFLPYHDLTIDDIYRRDTWRGLCTSAGVAETYEAPDETLIAIWLRRIAHVDDGLRLNAWRDWLANGGPGDTMTLCLLAPLLDSRAELTTAADVWKLLGRNPALYDDAENLLKFLAGHANRLSTRKPDSAQDLDFVLHAGYTREEIMALTGGRTWERPSGNREGLLHVPDLRLDVFMVTLNKTETDYSPSTLYEDYAIDSRLFHWQSQSTTSDISPTGKRYINHEAKGYRPLLFVREERRHNDLAQAYIYLGPVTYESHSGSKPISFIWRTEHPMPARVLRLTRRLIPA